MSHATLQSPIGPILVSADDKLLTGVRIGASDLADAPTPLLREAIAQLAAWFEGRLVDFDLPLAPLKSPRGEDHSAAICAIPYGETASYGELARRISSSPRAIGQACRRNPMPIIIPCHRVLGAGGVIGHYTGGEGITTKLWLLQREQRKG
ncbi:methylated-DNA-[protein]-cysteine S-methyltransferase [Sphingomonas laterariae]|uniref:Methylated-DNA-[protein]-cysteine S-methyltransferase n=1 Tax=Edaphosphingomonas laterariae TaxID=861865 RepID=A0A239GS60_9SPHN|nr:methylated-DNA--[protein]-cysteine S-methyltransferase [Sphingomonas laterariae]SNS72049.1 methylated-DNA-[protein]-cysteine S-methyltransferase [Sphingomonas laterariae]